MPNHLVCPPPIDLGLLHARVAERVANHQGAVPGEALHHDAGELPHHGATWQLPVELRRATAAVARKLLGDVLAIMSGHAPHHQVGTAVLFEVTPVVQGAHGLAPHVPDPLAEPSGSLTQNAAGSP